VSGAHAAYDDRMRLSALLVPLLLAGLAPAGTAQEEKPAAPPSIYDEQADARADVQAAVARAAKKNKRVLVMWGGNWCVWCHRLHAVLKRGRVAREMLYEYELVLVDSQGNRDFAAELGADLGQGVPFLTVLDAAGEVVTQQETAALEAGDGHDEAKVMAFLEQHRAAPQDASKVLAEARVRAAREKKRVFLRFGAPW
jgi:thiol:disulfide interchange protein